MSKGILWAIPIRDGAPYVMPKHPIIPHSHITLQYDADSNDWSKWIGHQFTAQMLSQYADGRVHAIKFRIPDEIPFGLTVPHMTVSRIEEAAPVESTDMILASQPMDIKIDVPCREFRIEFIDFKKPEK